MDMPKTWDYARALLRSWRRGHKRFATPFAQQLDELPTGKCGHHGAGEGQGPLSDHVKAGQSR